jgi:hypothetical protein
LQEPAPALIVPAGEEEEEKGNGMEVEEPKPGIFDEPEAETSLIVGEQKVEAMVDLDESEVEEEVEEREVIELATEPKPSRIWPGVSTDRAERYGREVDAVRKVFEDGIDVYDATVVSEYAGGIFDYTGDLGKLCGHWQSKQNYSHFVKNLPISCFTLWSVKFAVFAAFPLATTSLQSLIQCWTFC